MGRPARDSPARASPPVSLMRKGGLGRATPGLRSGQGLCPGAGGCSRAQQDPLQPLHRPAGPAEASTREVRGPAPPHSELGLGCHGLASCGKVCSAAAAKDGAERRLSTRCPAPVGLSGAECGLGSVGRRENESPPATHCRLVLWGRGSEWGQPRGFAGGGARSSALIASTAACTGAPLRTRPPQPAAPAAGRGRPEAPEQGARGPTSASGWAAGPSPPRGSQLAQLLCGAAVCRFLPSPVRAEAASRPAAGDALRSCLEQRPFQDRSRGAPVRATRFPRAPLTPLLCGDPLPSAPTSGPAETPPPPRGPLGGFQL